MIGSTIRLPEIVRLGANSGQPQPDTKITTTWLLQEADKTITLPLNSGNGAAFNFEVDWGDGTIETITTTTATHTYATAGLKTVTIDGQCEGWSFNNGGDKLKIKSISGGYGHVFKYLYGAFYGCVNLVSAIVGNWDTSSVTDMSLLFSNCRAIVTDIDVGNWDTSSVTKMSQLFSYCTIMTAAPNVNNWDVSKVIFMTQMFAGSNLVTGLDISTLNVTKVGYASNFISAPIMSTSAYDAFLINADSLPSVSTCSWVFSTVKYTAGGAAEAARTSLIGKGWTITDGGAA